MTAATHHHGCPTGLQLPSSAGALGTSLAAAPHTTATQGGTVSAFNRAGTHDPIFAAVIAWALAAVAADGSRAARGLVADATLDRLRKAARAGCGLAVLLVCTQI